MSCNKNLTPLMEGVDAGWAIPSQLDEALLRTDSSRHASHFDAGAMDAHDIKSALIDDFDLDSGWCLAEGTVEYEPLPFVDSEARMPLSYSPAPLESDRVLALELQEEFSKPDLALGTDVDLPPPSGLWFAELTGVVPKKVVQAAPSRLQARAVNIKSCFTEMEHAFFATGDDLEQSSQIARQELLDLDDEPQPQGKTRKKRWWPWRKRAASIAS